MGQLQQDFVNRLRNNITNVMRTAEDLKITLDVTAARNYAGEWTDGDLTDVQVNGKTMTKAELVTLVGVVDDVLAFLGNQPVATMDRAAVFNKYRNDI